MKLSIVVCAYNEEESIGPLLENLQRQEVSPEIADREIIVVASGCTDGTVDVVKSHMSGDETINLIEEHARLGKASALNKAFEASSGDYIVLVPADVEPADKALLNLLAPFNDEAVSAVSGNPLQTPRNAPRNTAGCLARKTYRLWSRLNRRLNDVGQMAHCSGELMALRGTVKSNVPSECAADDSYIAVMAKKKGLIKFASNAVCYNILPSNVADYVNQRRRWLFGHFQTKKMTGEYPTVMDTLVLSRPHLVLQILAEEIRESPSEAGHLLSVIVVEAVVYLLSMLDRLFSRQKAIWPVITSTKRIRSVGEEGRR